MYTHRHTHRDTVEPKEKSPWFRERAINEIHSARLRKCGCLGPLHGLGTLRCAIELLQHHAFHYSAVRAVVARSVIRRTPSDLSRYFYTVY